MRTNPVSFLSTNRRYTLVVALFAASLSLLYVWSWLFFSGLREQRFKEAFMDVPDKVWSVCSFAAG